MIMLLLPANLLNWLWRALAATGRRALTNYILQSIICTFFFYEYLVLDILEDCSNGNCMVWLQK